MVQYRYTILSLSYPSISGLSSLTLLPLLISTLFCMQEIRIVINQINESSSDRVLEAYFTMVARDTNNKVVLYTLYFPVSFFSVDDILINWYRLVCPSTPIIPANGRREATISKWREYAFHSIPVYHSYHLHHSFFFSNINPIIYFSLSGNSKRRKLASTLSLENKPPTDEERQSMYLYIFLQSHPFVPYQQEISLSLLPFSLYLSIYLSML